MIWYKPIHIHIHLHLVLEKTLVMDAGRFPSRLNLMEGAFCQQVHCLQIRPGSMNLWLGRIFPIFWLLYLKALVWLRFGLGHFLNEQSIKGMTKRLINSLIRSGSQLVASRTAKFISRCACVAFSGWRWCLQVSMNPDPPAWNNLPVTSGTSASQAGLMFCHGLSLEHGKNEWLGGFFSCRFHGLQW